MPLDPLKTPQRGPKPQQPYGHLKGRKPLVLKRKEKIFLLRPPCAPNRQRQNSLKHEGSHLCIFTPKIMRFQPSTFIQISISSI